MISEELIKNVLVEQREGLLRRKYGVKRDVLSRIDEKKKLPHVVVLTGMRRVGKSTLLRQIIKEHYNDDDFYYINFEDERLFNFPVNEVNRLYESLIELFGKKKVFFIDEIQNLDNFEVFVRRFYEDGFKFYITGSSASLLSKELGTKLTGRHVDIVVKPFSFLEFLKLKKFEFDRGEIYRSDVKIKIKSYFDEYLVRGGMPEYLIYGDLEILDRVYEDILLKDVAVRYGIDNIRQLRELYQYLVTNFANRFSFNTLKKIINLGSVNTIKKYISYLEDTYFAKTINKFDFSLKKQLVNDKKLYVVDNGFISVISNRLTKDKGWLLENLVFNLLGDNVYYYRNGYECDFLVVKNKKVTKAIQVCFELNEKNRAREFGGLIETLKQFNLKEGLVLTYNREDELELENKRIKIVPIWRWILDGLR